MAKGYTVARADFKAETPTLNCSEQEAFEDDSRQRDEEWCRMDVHAGEWKRTQHMNTNCNACNKQDATLSQGGLCGAAVLPYT